MSVSKTFLGLLEGGASHGYDLKHEYDATFGLDRPVAYGQVYATLARLLKSGLVTVDAVEPGEGPDRKRYAITDGWRRRRRAMARRGPSRRTVSAERRSTRR